MLNAFSRLKLRVRISIYFEVDFKLILLRYHRWPVDQLAVTKQTRAKGLGRPLFVNTIWGAGGTQPPLWPLVAVLAVATFRLQRQGWVVAKRSLSGPWDPNCGWPSPVPPLPGQWGTVASVSQRTAWRHAESDSPFSRDAAVAHHLLGFNTHASSVLTATAWNETALPRREEGRNKQTRSQRPALCSQDLAGKVF